MDRFLVLDDFLQMMVYDQRCNPTNSVNKLYVKFLYPLFWQEVGRSKSDYDYDYDYVINGFITDHALSYSFIHSFIH